MSAAPRLRIGLAASGRHREGPDALLFPLLRGVERDLRDGLSLQIFALGRTHDALLAQGLFRRYDGLHRLPDRRHGGIVNLVTMLLEEQPGRSLDAVIYLLDPDDPTSIYPEGLALKRQCVIHGKPFVSTFAHAREWIELARCNHGLAPDRSLDAYFGLADETLALVAHDARKDEMEAFATEYFGLLDRFAKRYATGTTGGRLNRLAQTITHRSEPWAELLRSGPLGGDAQIAGLVLERKCRRVIFFEDPHVARQHEADIQLLERAARIATDFALCVSDPASARQWARGYAARVTRAALPA